MNKVNGRGKVDEGIEKTNILVILFINFFPDQKLQQYLLMLIVTFDNTISLCSIGFNRINKLGYTGRENITHS